MFSDSGPNHDAIEIDRLAVLAVPLSGANSTEETVFGENPHGYILLVLPLDFGDLRYRETNFIAIQFGNRSNTMNVPD